MNPTVSPLAWVRGYDKRAPGPIPKTQTALYRMSSLVNKGFISPADGRGLLLDAGLVDFAWQVTWAEDYDTADVELEDRIGNVQGYVIFVHGWTGNHTIFEDLPGMVVRANRRLVALAVDHNGFGQSRFVKDVPPIETCNPPAAMKVLEKWIKAIKIRRQPGESATKVINFVGHSMGGATLFYLNPMLWRIGEETRYALAPALLLNDATHKAFYTTLGLGIGLVGRFPALSVVERAIKPGMLETLCAGASAQVKAAHHLQYDETPRGITAATFSAMGLLDNAEIARKWDLFRVMLGHRDPLVGLVPMIDLLCGMEFPVGQIRVVPGTHYMFSVGRDSAFQHSQSRDLVVQDVLALHEKAYQLQKTGQLVG